MTAKSLSTILAAVLLLAACQPANAKPSAQQQLQQALTAYEKGDYQTAFKLYGKRASQGDAEAQFNLGVMYDNGKGVPQDHAKARAWYEKAAAQGLAVAQYNLGIMYDNGKGVPQDHAKARAWYEKAAVQGYADAEKALRRLKRAGY